MAALRNEPAQQPVTTFAAVPHAMAVPLSYDDNRSSCLRIELRSTSDLCHCQRVVMLIPLWLREGTGDSAGVK